jgi:excisionase family DNA binding protein
MEWLTTVQVGERLGLHRTSVLALVESGRLRARYIRGTERPTIRIRSEDLDEFIATWTDDGDGSAEHPER